MNRAAFYAVLRARNSGMFGTSLSGKQVAGMEAILNEAETMGAPLRFLAYMLATTYLETANTMQPITEYGKVSYFDKYEPGTSIGKTLGNTLKGDGYRFRGRGFVQLTGRRNYTLAARKVGTDLVAYPDRALDLDIASEIMFAGMTEGWFTGKKLADYINLDKTDYYNARRIINGTDKAASIAADAKVFEQALRDGEYTSQKPAPSPVSAPKPVPATPQPPKAATAADGPVWQPFEFPVTGDPDKQGGGFFKALLTLLKGSFT